MDFSHTEERRMIADQLSRWLRENYDMEIRAAAIEAGYSRDAYAALSELGIGAALLSEASGGFGGSGHDIAVVFEELGRALAVEPWIASNVLAARCLEADDPLLEEIATGGKTVALAHGEAGGRYALDFVKAEAVKAAGGWEITGGKSVVVHGDSADVLLVSARTGDSVSLFKVDGAAVERRAYPTIDGFPAAEITLSGVAGELVGQEGDGLSRIEAAQRAAILAVSAEALGAMETAQAMTLEYIQNRTQFGQAIGKFQVLQHRMVDMVTKIIQTRSMVVNAASAMGTVDEARRIAALKYYVGEAGRFVAEEAIQLHGAIGLAGETPITHYAKRLVMIDHMFGDTDHHLQRYIELNTA